MLRNSSKRIVVRGLFGIKIQTLLIRSGGVTEETVYSASYPARRLSQRE